MDNNTLNEFQVANELSKKFYGNLAQTATNEHAVVAQSAMSHERRFKKLLDLGDFQGKSILDIGCGLGGFNKYLLSLGIQADYYGIDITPDMIERAKTLNPDIESHFEVFDILGSDYHRTFDYSIAVGILNLNFGPGVNDEMNLRLMSQMAKHSTIGFAVSMTSDLSPRPTPDTFYFNAGTIINQMTTLTKNYKLDHSYLPNDFTIYGYMEDFFKK